jgi:Tfp pilus assembly protein PilV
MRCRPSRQGAESGETLIEVLLASALMALIVVAIIGGMSTMLLSSTLHRQQTDANTYLVSAMERIRSSDFLRWKCTDAGTADAVYGSKAQEVIMPAGWTIGVDPDYPVQFQYIDTTGSAPAVKFGSACSELTPLQLVTLKVTSPGTRVTPTLSFVKGG